MEFMCEIVLFIEKLHQEYDCTVSAGQTRSRLLDTSVGGYELIPQEA